jgi:regulation of enolase protein 1 (concanavalin A-like superfamily)
VTHPLQSGAWLNEAADATVDDDGVRITTSPGTDLWQRTYYGFRTDNAPALLVGVRDDVTLTVRVTGAYRRRYDQAGVLVRVDADAWAKASIEHEDGARSRLGCVVTNGGYSDWSTRDIASTEQYWYRLSRRGSDFRVEAAPDGVTWEQLRIFHLHALGGTDRATGATQHSASGEPVQIGVYACSPEDSSFEARFDRITVHPTVWTPHV